jgi:hypothetical protein
VSAGAAPASAHTPVNVNVSALPGNQSEAAIAVDPADPANEVVVSNTTNDRLFLGVSHDGGTTWTRRFIATGNRLGSACCDPSLSWDEQGNLFLAWLDAKDVTALPLAMSTDAGESWHLVTVLHPPKARVSSGAPLGRTLAAGDGGEEGGHGGVFIDQPTVTTSEGMVWLVWNNGSMQADGARVSGLGEVGRFHAVEKVPGTRDCTFGDVAVGPDGQVMQVCTHDVFVDHAYVHTSVRVNVDPDGLGAAGFGPSVLASTTNVRQFDPIRPQEDRTVDAESGLAWDRTGGTFAGRVYLVYTDEQPAGSDRTDIWVRISDDDGATWSAPVKVNDDPLAHRSQFLPRIALDQTSGNVAVGFHDARNDAGDFTFGDTDGRANDDAMYYLAFSADGGATFGANIQVAAGVSNAEDAANGIDYGDYTGLTFTAGVAHPAWADNSDSTGDNPNGALHQFDIYTAAVPVT